VSSKLGLYMIKQFLPIHEKKQLLQILVMKISGCTDRIQISVMHLEVLSELVLWFKMQQMSTTAYKKCDHSVFCHRC